jgi:hypothetical protein
MRVEVWMLEANVPPNRRRERAFQIFAQPVEHPFTADRARPEPQPKPGSVAGLEAWIASRQAPQAARPGLADAPRAPRLAEMSPFLPPTPLGGLTLAGRNPHL